MSLNKSKRSTEELFGRPLPNLEKQELTVEVEETIDLSPSPDPQPQTDPTALRALKNFSSSVNGCTKSFVEGEVITEPYILSYFKRTPGFPIEPLSPDAKHCPYCKKVAP